MKKVLYILGGLIAVLLIAMISIPFFFKDQIKAEIDKQIAKNVNATVYFDANKFSLSLFKDFPNLTVSLNDFGVVGKDEFKGDTLTSIKGFNIVVDLKSVIFGDQIKIKGVVLDQPRIFAQVNKFGKANWDITFPDTIKVVATPADTSKFDISIESWKIKNGFVVYEDKTSDLYAKLINLNHQGSGDISSDVFDLMTKTQVDTAICVMGNIPYLNKNSLDINMNLNIDNKNAKYTFKENTFKINQFTLGFDGWLAMPDTSIDMDLKFGAKETEFKNILSLVPAVFLSDFDKIKTDGKLAFDGFAKGRYNGATMPAFALNLKVDNGMFQYPELPTPVNNINLDLHVENKDVIDNLLVHVKKFHMDMGKNPVDATVLLQGLTNMNVDANVTARLNLAEVMTMFPVAGTTLRGLFSLNVKAKGVYNELQKKMPNVTADMGLTSGYAKTSSFPSALDALSMLATVTNETGNLTDTKVHLKDMRFSMDGQPFEMSAYVENLADYTWDLDAKGIVDLSKITKIFPLEGMTLAGIIDIKDFTTKGKMSYVTAGKYGQLPTSGIMNFKDFSYVSKDMPQGFKMTKATLNFTPKDINIPVLEGFAGKSDINVNGTVSNYISYLFGDGTIKGVVNFKSNEFDVDEWMTDSPAPTTPAPATKPLTVIEVPKNIDFLLNSDIKKVDYSNYGITNLKGGILVKDGAVKMQNLVLNMLDASVKTNGTYDTKDMQHPLFDFDLDIQNMSINKAATTFNTVKSFAPIAEKVNGNANFTFKINGELEKDMMPKLPTLNGNGVIKIAQAQITNVAVFDGLAKLTKMSNLNNQILSDVTLKVKIKDGRAYVEPFDIKAGNSIINLGGSQGLDGTLDYIIKTDMPAGAAGAAANTVIANATGQTGVIGDRIKLNFKMGGTSSKPTFTPTGGSSSTGGSAVDAAKKAVTDKAKAEIDAQKKAVMDKANAELDAQKAAAQKQAQAEADRLKAEADQKVKDQQDALKKQAEDKAKKGLKNLGF